MIQHISIIRMMTRALNSQYKSIAALAVPHVASKGPDTLDFTKRCGKGVELVFWEMGRKTVDVDIGCL